MKNKFPAMQLLVLIAGVGMTAASMAAVTADFTVTGEIEPVACSLMATETAIDFGKIVLNKDINNVTEIRKEGGTLTVSCGAGAIPLLSIVDNKSDTKAPIDDDGAGVASHATFGLGLSDGKKIGQYAVNLLMPSTKNTVADNTGISSSSDGGRNWGGGAGITSMATDLLFSWTKRGTASQIVDTSFTAYLEYIAYMPKRTLLDLSKKITLDGSFTILMSYL